MIGDTLKKMRQIYGYKASELSTMLGISASYLSEIENNKKEPSLSLLKKIAEVYDIKLSSLVLISESCEEAEKHGFGAAIVRRTMIALINKFAAPLEDSIE